jgi:hypothetical protein
MVITQKDPLLCFINYSLISNSRDFLSFTSSWCICQSEKKITVVKKKPPHINWSAIWTKEKDGQLFPFLVHASIKPLHLLGHL